MCGIAGIAGSSPLNIKSFCKQANELQKHRGPDNQNLYVGSNIGLAHQRLSILDVGSRANQPFSYGGLHLVYNGEIYNYQALRSEYCNDVDFKTDSDTEVLIHLWNLLGMRCLPLLEGMFSFAIYDENLDTVF